MKFLTVALLLGAVASKKRFEESLSKKGRKATERTGTADTKEYETSPTDGKYNTKARLGFKLRPVPSFRVLVFNQTDDQAEAFGYRVNLLRLAEVEGTTNALNSTNVINLKGRGNPWVFNSTTDRVVNDVTIKTLQATFTQQNGSNPATAVTLSGQFALAEVADGGKTRKPNALKWSMNVTDFPYTSDNSKLAFLLSVNSKQNRTAYVNEGLIKNLSIGSGNGTFTWEPTVLVNGVQKNLVVTDLGTRADLEEAQDTFKFVGESATYLQFTVDAINRANKIFWDPENEVNEDQILGNESGATSFQLSLAIIWGFFMITILA